MPGLNDEVDLEYPDTSLDTLAKDYVTPKEKQKEVIPSKNVYLVDDTIDGKGKEEATDKVDVTEGVKPEDIANLETKFVFIEQQTNALSDSQSAFESLKKAGTISQEGFNVLNCVIPNYSKDGDNVAFYTKSPSATRYNQTVVKLGKLISAQEELLERALDETKVDLVTSLNHTLKSIKKFFEDTVEQRKENKSTAKNSVNGLTQTLKESIGETINKTYEEFPSLVALLNKLCANKQEFDETTLLQVIDLKTAVLENSEIKFTTEQLIDFIASDVESAFIKTVRDYLEAKIKELEADDISDEMLKQTHVANKGIYKLLMGLDKVSLLALSLINQNSSPAK